MASSADPTKVAADHDGPGGAMPEVKNWVQRPPSWRPIVSQGSPPGPRSGAASVVLGNKMYMFGGYGGSGRLDDFFEFDCDKRSWRQITCLGDAPGVRENNGMVVHGQCLYLFGGYNGSTWLNDFHEFDLRSGSWRLVEPKGTPPAPRFGYVSAVWADSFIVFGGYDGSTWLNDLHEYNFKTGKWSRIEIQAGGPWPSIRSCPSWTQMDKNVYIFGGYDGVQRMNDFYALHMDTFTWTKMRTAGAIPSPRYFHASVIHANCMYTFGGYNGASRLNDMHCYSFETNRWSVLETSGDPPSGRSSIVAQVFGNSLLVFGGYDGKMVLNDFFEFRFQPLVIAAGTLVDDLRLLVNNKRFSDVTFVVEGKPLYATRSLLAVRSEHFKALLFGGMREAAVGAEIEISDVSYDVFLKVLEYLYTDHLEGDISADIAVPLLMASERYLLTRLKGLCEDSIRKRIAADNVVGIFMAAHAHRALGLKEICFDFILEHLPDVKNTKGFMELKAEPDLLMEIIMRQTDTGRAW